LDGAKGFGVQATLMVRLDYISSGAGVATKGGRLEMEAGGARNRWDGVIE
jgi:hypothetical protein